MPTSKEIPVERKPDLEERAGVELAGLYAAWDGDELTTVNGEIRLRPGTAPEHDLQIVAAAYDAQGRVIGRGECLVLKGEFLGFDVFSMPVFHPPQPPTKVLVFVGPRV